MSPLDRIAQLSDENALLRSQLRDAQEQAKRDSETISRLRSRNEDLGDLIFATVVRVRHENATGNLILSAWLPDACDALSLSRHA